MDKKRNMGTYLLASVMPGVLLLSVYIALGVYPFGQRSLLITDMSQLYVDFYSYLIDVFHGQKALFFSWEGGLGMNMTGVVSFYLASPFSFLIAFFDKQSVTEGILLITILKTAACGLTFSIYTRKALHLCAAPNLCFSIAYSLMSYVIVYALNIMWLDGVIFLPLVLLGLHRLQDKGSMLLLTIAYTLLFIAQFYIAYMVGIFSLLYFAGLCVVEKRFSLRTIGKFFVSVVLAAGLSAFLWLPTYEQLAYVYLPEPQSFSTGDVTFSKIFSKTLFGSYDSLTYGLPNLYCGMLTMLFVPLYFFNRRISLREKIVSAVISLLLCVSMMVWRLNLLWHGGDEPTWFPYRFSFLLTFCGLFMAIRAFRYHKEYLPRAYGLSVLFSALLMGGLWCFHYEWVTFENLLASILLLLLYGFFMMVSCFRPQLKNVLAVFALLSVCFEMGMNGGNLVDSLDSQFGYEDRSTYTENYNRKEALVQQACRLDSGWYRLEDKTRRNANDAFSLGYHGLAHYSSFTNRNMSSFLSRLGVSARVQGRFLRYSGSSNVIDSLLGIRYVIGRRAPHQDYVPAAEIDGFRLYENPDALPAAFLSSTDLGGFHIAQDENVFEAQNHLMSALLGEEKEYFTAVDGVEMTPSRYAYPGQWFSDGWCTVTKMEGEEAYLEFSLVNDKDQEIYFYMTSSGFADNNYLFLDGRILEDEKHPLTGAVDLGWFEEGETIKIQMYLNGDLTYLQMPLFYGFDAEAFHQDYDALKARGMTEITQDLTGLSGTVEVEEGEAVLFTSLPADPGWTVWVDGEQTPWNTVSDAFLTVRLSKGSHRVSFTFCPAGLREGLLITAASGAVGILGVFWFRFLRSRVKSNGRR